MLHGRAKFVYNTHLEPHLFDAEGQMRPLVVDALILFANNYLSFLSRLGIPVSADDVRDILAYGSTTNYYYDDASDIDVVIFVDWTKISKNLPGLDMSAMGHALMSAWKRGYNLRILGRRVDMHIENINDPSEGPDVIKPGSIYSLMRRCWIRRPEMLSNDAVKQIRRDAMARYRKIRQTYYEIRLNKMGPKYITSFIKTLREEKNKSVHENALCPITPTIMAYRMARKVGILDDLNARIAQQSVKNFDLSFLE